jgi:hypothetical protein
MHSKFQMVSSFRLLFLIILCLGIKVSGQKNMLISYMAKPPQIDGIFSAGEWDYIQPASGFIQMEPDKGRNASEITKVYASFDSINIYVAFSCIQGSSNPMTGGLSITNGIVEWEAAAGPSATGWVCEMAIPFGSIKYRATDEVWGINFGRILISNLETSRWSGEMADNFRISQGGQLEGIRAPVRPKRLMLFPYVSLRYENSDYTGQYNKLKPDVGGDILVNLSSNFSMNATINPDFASVEGDLVNINQTGFLRDDNRHELDADLSYTFWFNESFMRYIRVFFGNNVFWGLDGIMRGHTFRDYIRFYLTRNFSYRFYIDYRYQVRHSTDASGQPEELYFYNYFIENELGYNTDASSYASLSFSTGRNFNRKMKIIQGDVALQALERLTVKYNISWLNFGADTLSYPG